MTRATPTTEEQPMNEPYTGKTERLECPHDLWIGVSQHDDIVHQYKRCRRCGVDFDLPAGLVTPERLRELEQAEEERDALASDLAAARTQNQTLQTEIDRLQRGVINIVAADRSHPDYRRLVDHVLNPLEITHRNEDGTYQYQERKWVAPAQVEATTNG